MKFRYTEHEIKTLTDYQLLRCLVTERKSTLNHYSSLYKRLQKLEIKLNDKEKLTK